MFILINDIFQHTKVLSILLVVTTTKGITGNDHLDQTFFERK